MIQRFLNWPSRVLIAFSILLIAAPIYASELIPNDPGFGQLWQLQKMRVPEIWSESTGSSDVVVAIIDSGVDIDHPDLSANIWTNPGEIPNNGVDDDQNGFIDDVHGWDFVSHSNDPRPKVLAANSSGPGYHHGTILAGIIGAEGNNAQGIVGVNWRVSILPIRAITSDGVGSVQAVAQAIDYAVHEHAEIINLSFVGEQNDTLLSQAVERASRAGILIVAAAGNEIDDDPQISAGAVDIDVHPLFPVCHHQNTDDLVIGVVSVDQNDRRSVFSSFGHQCIDLSAPGEGVISTRASVLGDSSRPYGGTFKGTSMSAAYVSGVAALLRSIVPQSTMMLIKSSLVQAADPIDEQNPEYRQKLGSGRVNALAALQWLRLHSPAIAPPSISALINGNKTTIAPTTSPIKKAVAQTPTVENSLTNRFVVGAYAAGRINKIEISTFTTHHARVSGFSVTTPWKSLGQIEVFASNDIVLISPEKEEPLLIGYTQYGVETFRMRPFTKDTSGGLWVVPINDLSLALMSRSNTNTLVKIYSSRGTFIRQWTVPQQQKQAPVLLTVVGSRKSLLAVVTKDVISIFDDSGKQERIKITLTPKEKNLQRLVVVEYKNQYVIEPSDLNGSEYSTPNPLLWKILFQEHYQRYRGIIRVSYKYP